MNQVNQLKDNLSEQIYGMKRSTGIEKGLCIHCKEPALPKCYSEAGRKEYKISGLCEKCFDSIFQME